MRYSIDERVLNNIGDAIRDKMGDTRIESLPAIKKISRTPNMSGLDQKPTALSETQYSFYDVIRIPNAQQIKIKLSATFTSGIDGIKIAAGEFSEMPANAIDYRTTVGTIDLAFNNTDVITIYHYNNGYNQWNIHNGYYAEILGYDKNGWPIMDDEEEFIDVEVYNSYYPQEMAQAIINMPPFPPSDAFLITGDCSYVFTNGTWDWFIELYGDYIQTQDITIGSNMFYYSNVEKIPFELNFKTNLGDINVSSMFSSAQYLKEIPRINDCRASNMSTIFRGCHRVRYLPEDICDYFIWTSIDGATSAYAGSRQAMLQECTSLRSVPMDFLAHGNPNCTYSYSFFYNGFYNCMALDELVDIPLVFTATWSTNAFYYTFNNCNRLKNLTFAMPNGQPYVMKWKSQTIDLSNYVGYSSTTHSIISYNSGITADKQVKDDVTYQALKDDPDWFTINIAYSRYNHDSAVATINSLPDTSAYLASAGGTNTIKFKKASGSLTDGGAIDTLTAEEIAVATAKGWTVSMS